MVQGGANIRGAGLAWQRSGGDRGRGGLGGRVPPGWSWNESGSARHGRSTAAAGVTAFLPESTRNRKSCPP